MIHAALPHDARAGKRLDRQRRLDGRPDRALRRPRLHRGQGRDHQPHPLDGHHLRQTGRARQLRLPGLHRHADDRTGDRRCSTTRRPDTRWCRWAAPGSPEEMAYAILFLGSDESSYCTGTALLADGGCTSRSFPAGLIGRMNSVPIDQLQVGDAAESRKTVSESDVYLFAGITGDFNPLHVDAEYAKGTPFGARVAHGPLTLSLCAGPARDRAARPRHGRGHQRRRVQGAGLLRRHDRASGSRSPSSTRSATGRRWRSPGPTRTAPRSPAARASARGRG